MLKLHRHSQNLETSKLTGDFSFFIIENLTLDCLHSSCHFTIVLHCTCMLQSSSKTFCIYQLQMERKEKPGTIHNGQCLISLITCIQTPHLQHSWMCHYYLLWTENNLLSKMILEGDLYLWLPVSSFSAFDR